MSVRRTRMVSMEALFFSCRSLHTRDGTGVKGKDAIHFVLIGKHVTNVSFGLMVFFSVAKGICIGCIQKFITLGQG